MFMTSCISPQKVTQPIHLVDNSLAKFSQLNCTWILLHALLTAVCQMCGSIRQLNQPESVVGEFAAFLFATDDNYGDERRPVKIPVAIQYWCSGRSGGDWEMKRQNVCSNHMMSRVSFTGLDYEWGTGVHLKMTILWQSQLAVSVTGILFYCGLSFCKRKLSM